jgi:hypothetical protein
MVQDLELREHSRTMDRSMGTPEAVRDQLSLPDTVEEHDAAARLFNKH